MLDIILNAAITGLFASIGAFLVTIYMKKSLKNEFKEELITFLESEDAPKLLNAVGAYFGRGIFSQMSRANPLKGNINIMGIKIPKVIAFGAAKKWGLLPKEMMGGNAETEAPATSENPELNKFRK